MTDNRGFPDPLTVLPQPFASAASPHAGRHEADELLSRLAGAEIDRLLAGEDVGSPPPSVSPVSPVSPAPPAGMSEDIHVVAAPDAGTTTPATDLKTDPFVEPERAELARALDAMFEGMAKDEDPAAVFQTHDQEKRRSGDVSAAVPRATQGSVSDGPLPVTSPAVFPVTNQVSAAASADGESDVLTGRGSSWWGRGLLAILAFLNAPFARLPDAARDFAGKLALLTLLNALVLIALVLWRGR